MFLFGNFQLHAEVPIYRLLLLFLAHFSRFFADFMRMLDLCLLLDDHCFAVPLTQTSVYVIIQFQLLEFLRNNSQSF